MIAWMFTIAAAWLGLACLIVGFCALLPREDRTPRALRTGSRWRQPDAEK